MNLRVCVPGSTSWCISERHGYSCVAAVGGESDSCVRVVVVNVVVQLPSVTVTPVWPPLDGNSDSRVRIVVVDVVEHL